MKLYEFIIILSCLLLVFCQSASSAELIGPTEDPIRIGVGARLMGMGKAFVAIADDGSAIFSNPAGLAEINSWYVLSMYSSLLNEIPYFTLSYSRPVSFWGIKGGLGIGYVGSGVADIISPSQTGFTYFDYYNNVYLLSLAGRINKSLSLGLNFKFFDEGYSGVVVASGTGKDIDLGIKYIYSDWASLGLTLQNVLPASLGGKVEWNGYSESIPCILKVGGAFKLFDNRLCLAVDNDMWLSRKLPSQLHVGAEWEMSPILILRGGVDQNLSSATGGVASNPTFGVGLRLWGAGFDYAYHPYSEEQGNITHFFSLSFSPAIYEKTTSVLPPPPKPRLKVQIDYPQDKLVSNKEKVIVKGKVNDKKIKILRINNEIAPFDEKGNYEKEIGLSVGKNTIWTAGFDQNEKRIYTRSVRVLRLKSFSDVPDDFWAKEEIERLATLGIMLVDEDGEFYPEETVNRAYVLIQLVDLNGISMPTIEVTDLPFKDVKPGELIAPYLKAGYDSKLVYGCPDGTFRPWRMCNRMESIVMVVRFSKIKLSEVLERPYLDIPSRHWAIKEIYAARQNGLLKFILDGLYPHKHITRAEFAFMLSKTPKVLFKINKLHNFETGYQKSYPY